ncbi:MAG: 1-deoxy-D-xylulose-5-phosphate reductoisomerase, partial [Desulfovibrio sp.]
MSSWDEATTRSIVVLGSTGSIGRNALDVISRHMDRFMVLGLAGARNIALLAEQAARFKPPYLAVLDANRAKELRDMLPAGYSPEILVGPDGYAAMAGL